MDWRKWTDEGVLTEEWNRFCDISAYFIEAHLMLDASVGTYPFTTRLLNNSLKVLSSQVQRGWCLDVALAWPR